MLWLVPSFCTMAKNPPKIKIFISAECQITRLDRPWLYFVSCLLTPRFCGFFPTWSYRYSTSTVDESVSAAFFLWMGCSFNVHDALLQALAFVLRNGPYVWLNSNNKCFCCCWVTDTVQLYILLNAYIIMYCRWHT